MTDNNHLSEEDICPHLGSVNDPELRYLFANPIHICMQTQPKGGISFDHQNAYCITPNHSECPLYQKKSGKSTPEFIHKIETSGTINRRSKWFWLSVALIILIISGVGLSIYFWGNETRTGRFSLIMADSPTPTIVLPEPSQTSTPLPTLTNTANPTETLTPTTRPSDTPIPTNTEAAPPTPGPNLGTPFGNYVLHRVKTGESLATIANIYQTTSERITAVNTILERRGVWDGDILVVPIGSEMADEIPFDYIFIEKKTDLATLAETHSRLPSINCASIICWAPWIGSLPAGG